MDELVLLAKYNDGNTDAFRYFYEKYYSALVNFGMQYVADDETVKDICQNLFVTIWERSYQFKTISAFKTFLYTSIRNRCLDYLKSSEHQKLRPLTDQERLKSDAYFQEKMMQEEVFLQLESLVKKLPNATRNVIELGLDGHKNEEIAQLLNISINTVKTHRKRGLVFLRKYMVGNYARVVKFIILAFTITLKLF
ncbi:RNA polymerase sigma-70 factor [Prolixibacteraceae bacterium JC049]|nr:RNA polymerase sigma-70 factor [Prolixibacteraceae bacterium JC049]